MYMLCRRCSIEIYLSLFYVGQWTKAFQDSMSHHRFSQDSHHRFSILTSLGQVYNTYLLVYLKHPWHLRVCVDFMHHCLAVFRRQPDQRSACLQEAIWSTNWSTKCLPVISLLVDHGKHAQKIRGIYMTYPLMTPIAKSSNVLSCCSTQESWERRSAFSVNSK